MHDNPLNITIDDTVHDEWHERDRNYLILYLKDADGDFGESIVELWDENYEQAVEDGMIDPRRPHESIFDHALDTGLLNPANRVKREPVPTGWVIVHEELGALVTWKAGGNMIWSNDAPAGEIDRGAASFGDETSAEKFFREDLDGEELADNEEFLKALSFYEVELDVTPEGHARPRRVSADKLAEIGVRIPSSVPAA